MGNKCCSCLKSRTDDGPGSVPSGKSRRLSKRSKVRIFGGKKNATVDTEQAATEEGETVNRLEEQLKNVQYDSLFIVAADTKELSDNPDNRISRAEENTSTAQEAASTVSITTNPDNRISPAEVNTSTAQEAASTVPTKTNPDNRISPAEVNTSTAQEAASTVPTKTNPDNRISPAEENTSSAKENASTVPTKINPDNRISPAEENTSTAEDVASTLPATTNPDNRISQAEEKTCTAEEVTSAVLVITDPDNRISPAKENFCTAEEVTTTVLVRTNPVNKISHAEENTCTAEEFTTTVLVRTNPVNRISPAEENTSNVKEAASTEPSTANSDDRISPAEEKPNTAQEAASTVSVNPKPSADITIKSSTSATHELNGSIRNDMLQTFEKDTDNASKSAAPSTKIDDPASQNENITNSEQREELTKYAFNQRTTTDRNLPALTTTETKNTTVSNCKGFTPAKPVLTESSTETDMKPFETDPRHQDKKYISNSSVDIPDIERKGTSHKQGHTQTNIIDAISTTKDAVLVPASVTQPLGNITAVTKSTVALSNTRTVRNVVRTDIENLKNDITTTLERTKGHMLNVNDKITEAESDTLVVDSTRQTLDSPTNHSITTTVESDIPTDLTSSNKKAISDSSVPTSVAEKKLPVNVTQTTDVNCKSTSPFDTKVSSCNREKPVSDLIFRSSRPIPKVSSEEALEPFRRLARVLAAAKSSAKMNSRSESTDLKGSSTNVQPQCPRPTSSLTTPITTTSTPVKSDISDQASTQAQVSSTDIRKCQSLPIFSRESKKVSDFAVPKGNKAPPMKPWKIKAKPKHLHALPPIASTDIEDESQRNWTQHESSSKKAQMPWMSRRPQFDVAFPTLGKTLLQRLGSVDKILAHRVVPLPRRIEMLKVEFGWYPGLRIKSKDMRTCPSIFNLTPPQTSLNGEDNCSDTDER